MSPELAPKVQDFSFLKMVSRAWDYWLKHLAECEKCQELKECGTGQKMVEYLAAAAMMDAKEVQVQAASARWNTKGTAA